MDLHLDRSGTLAEQVGAAHGITEADWTDVRPDVTAAQERLLERRVQKKLGFAELPFHTHAVDEILPMAHHVRYRFDHLVVLGIGGSALGLRCLVDALLNPAVAMVDRLDRRAVPKLLLFDNIDPDAFVPYLQQLDWSKTCINVVSKSGKTVETGAQFLLMRDFLQKRVGSRKWKDHVIVTTDPAVGPLRSLAICEGLQSFEVPPLVGGRFSCLSPVALFPAACAGVDIADVLAGARAMAEVCLHADLETNLAMQLAATHFVLDTKRHKPIAVMMPYVNALRRFVDWYIQLHAESLGKDGKGQTPLPAVGATDQHAQLQLFVDGPNNKMHTIITADKFQCAAKIPPTDESAFAFLGGHDLAELLNAQALATVQVLIEAKRPTLHLQIPALTPHVFGQLLFVYQWAIVLAAELYGVDAFTQPAVERGKQLARERLQRGASRVS